MTGSPARSAIPVSHAKAPVSPAKMAIGVSSTPPFIQSSRLMEAVIDIEHRLNAGQRVVRLRGAPGDGKTQAGRWLASRRANSYYAELPVATADEAVRDPDKIWREGLERLFETLTGEQLSGFSIALLCKNIRESLVGLDPPPVLILDNVDHAASFSLRDLLIGDQTACVLIGPGATAHDGEVILRQPTSDEFLAMVMAALGGRNHLPLSEDAVVRNIGNLLDNAAIGAAYVASHIIPGMPSELRALQRDIESATPTFEPRIHAVFRRAWANLSETAQRVTVLLAAFAEPEVPIVWIPESLRPAGALPCLYRSRLVDGIIGLDGSAGLRAHRLVIQWIRSNPSITDWTVVAEVLRAWSHDEELDENFKSGGPRKRAFCRAFELLATRGALGGLKPKARAHVELTYIDQSGLHSDDTGGAQAIERQFDYLSPSPEAIRDLHPAVLGQVIDTLRPRVIQRSKRLQGLRQLALEALAAALPSPLGPSGNIDTALDVIAEHHWGKYLVHANDNRAEAGLTFLRGAEDKATQVLIHAEGVERRLWLTRRAKTRLQIADALPKGSLETINILVQEHSNDELPEYLRITAATRILKISNNRSAEEVSADIRTTLALCRTSEHEEIRADFLAMAISTARKHHLSEPQKEITLFTLPMLDAYLTGAPASRRTKTATAFTISKSAEAQVDSDALAVMVRAMRLMNIAGIPGDGYQCSRSLAILREAGELDLAETMADAMQWRTQSDYFLLFEVAKTLRWVNRLPEANSILDRMEQILRKWQNDRSSDSFRYLQDERAKVAALENDLAKVERLLEENSAAYNAADEPLSAIECNRWLQALRERASIHAEDGILHDQWRCSQRRAAASPEVMKEVRTEAIRLARLMTPPTTHSAAHH